MDPPSPSLPSNRVQRSRTPRSRASQRKRTPKTPKTPRTPRSQRYKFSTTGSQVSHIATLEADAALRVFPAELHAQIKHYLDLRAHQRDKIELTFAKNGNTKLTVNADGFPAYFVIPETDQKLDAGRYRYGLVKGSPLIVVVKQKRDSAYEFNDGRPAIVLYHGKHSSAKGPHKVSKWAVWDVNGLHPDNLVWRVAEGAKAAIKEDVADEEMTEEQSEGSITVTRSSTPEQDDTNSKEQYSALSSYRSGVFGGQLPEENPVDLSRETTSPVQRVAIDASAPSAEYALPQRYIMDRLTQASRTNSFPLDPQLQLPQEPSNTFLQYGTLPMNAQSYRSGLGTWPKFSFTPTLPNAITTTQQYYLPQTLTNSSSLYNCCCRSIVMMRRYTEMAIATDRILTKGYQCTVNFQFRPSLHWSTRDTKTLEDCRTMPNLFAYGRLFRTISVTHHVISIHLVNSETHRAPVYMVMDDVAHWQSLMVIVEEEIILKENKAKGNGDSVESLELVVIDEGY